MTKQKKRRNRRKRKAAAVLSIDRPGSMSPGTARRLAAWLRMQADWLARAKTRKQMNGPGPFRARYLYAT